VQVSQTLTLMLRHRAPAALTPMNGLIVGRA